MLLERDTQLMALAQGFRPLAVDAHGAAAWFIERCQKVEHRAFAASGRPEERDELAFIHAQIYWPKCIHTLVCGLRRGEASRYLIELDGDHRYRSTSSYRSIMSRERVRTQACLRSASTSITRPS